MKNRPYVLIAALTAAILSCCSAGTDPNASGAASLRLENNSGQVISNLYLSPAAQNNWGANRLGAPLNPGYSYTVNNLIGGYWDMRAEGGNAYAREVMNVNLIGNSTGVWRLDP